MSKKIVLFTPVGGTDPISEVNGRDGSILQICRKYRPDIVHLYMSAEILEKHKKDDRYLYCLRKLDEMMGTQTECKIIERPNLYKVEEFDYFYREFSKLLFEIKKEMDENDELLLNVSSGTPAMKSALLVLCTLTGMTFKAIQVTTPEKGMNEHSHRGEDIQFLWEVNDDNDPSKYEDRTKEIECSWILSNQKMKLIRTHVLAYDYEAALGVNEQMPLYEDGSYVRMIEAAAQRKLLNDQKMFNKLKEIGEERNTAFRPVKNDEMRLLFEYILSLDIRQKRGEYGDLVRALTPPITELFIKVLEKYGTIKISDYYYLNDEKKKRWNLAKINGTVIENVMSRYLLWDDEQKTYIAKQSTKWSGNNKEYIQSTQLLNLIKEYVPSTKSELIQLCETVRFMEDAVRNRVAHEMLGVSDEFIKARVGFDSRDIVQTIQKILYYIDGGLKKYWNSYDEMNECILARMEKELAENEEE